MRGQAAASEGPLLSWRAAPPPPPLRLPATSHQPAPLPGGSQRWPACLLLLALLVSPGLEPPGKGGGGAICRLMPHGCIRSGQEVAWPPMARTQGAVESCGCGERMLRTMVDCWCVRRVMGAPCGFPCGSCRTSNPGLSGGWLPNSPPLCLWYPPPTLYLRCIYSSPSPSMYLPALRYLQ